MKEIDGISLLISSSFSPLFSQLSFFPYPYQLNVCPSGMINQFVNNVVWGELDYLVIDTPPGTSDERILFVSFLIFYLFVIFDFYFTFFYI